MKRSRSIWPVGIACLAGFLLLGYMGLMAPKAQASGAAIISLNYPWSCDGSFTPLATPLGKVIYNVPGNKPMMNLTYILQGAQPSTDYYVGFDVAQSDCPTTFGAITRFNCWTPGGGVPLAVFPVPGTLTTDASGDGALHVDLKDLASGTYDVAFWVAPASVFASQHKYIPVAATGCSNDEIAFQTVTIP